jgi:serine/threonine protein kinase
MSQGSRKAPPLAKGSVINDRYEIQEGLGKGGMGEVFSAYDRSTQQAVALKIVREESRMPGDDEALRHELLLARSVGHPNVCRVHDLAPSPWGPILVMELIDGVTLHTHIRRQKAKGGYTADEFRTIASEAAAGLAAIHAQGLVHGDLKPGNIMVTSDRAIILDFGFARERARVSARRAGAQPDGGTPNYMSPERLKSGGASPDDDIYALGLTLLEMWTCRVPEPGYRPRSKPMREQIMFDVSSGLSTSHAQIPRERISPGPPLGRAVARTFTPGAQSLLVTFAYNAEELAGRLFPLEKPTVTIGRRANQDICIAEPTCSGAHAQAQWQAGSWIIADLGSTNGTYADHSYERKRTVSLLHGGEVQLGECRVKLVSFEKSSPQHVRAMEYLAQRDGLTGLWKRQEMLIALKDELEFARWDRVPLTVATYEISSANRSPHDRPTILEMLALRRAAQRVAELTEVLLLSMVPVTAGRTDALKFMVAMTGPTLDEARNVVEQIVAQVRGSMPENLDLKASIILAEGNVSAEELMTS